MSDSPGRLLLLALPLLLSQLAKPARRRQEQLPEADHDRPAKRIEQVGLIVERYIAERIVDLRSAVEDVGGVDPERAAAQPGMLDRELRHLTEVRKQSEVERADR